MAGSHASLWWRACVALLATALLGAAGPANADTTRVAVAANFADAAMEIAEQFKRATGYDALLSFGSTGQLYAQITQAAPFEVFLAADAARPRRAIEDGLAVSGSRFTYATGRIALFSKNPEFISGAGTLKKADFSKLAIANPVTAPYGAAAVETMTALHVYEALEPKIVRGNNIAQAYQFIETGNAELGFVALSQIARHENGSRWIVPPDLYGPIAQDAVLLKRGTGNAAARAFLAFLNSPEANAIKKTYGYGLADERKR
jgi:molybdate transport system substrate-binding protein